jgi:hypothetical protein
MLILQGKSSGTDQFPEAITLKHFQKLKSTIKALTKSNEKGEMDNELSIIRRA